MLRCPVKMRVLVVLAACLLAVPAWPCAVVPPPQARVRIAEESALIIWDERTRTEHFVRRAEFTVGGQPAHFGFLVPTPTPPVLAAAPDEAFTRLIEATRPAVERHTRSRFDFTPMFLMAFMLQRGGAPPPPVRVLRQQRVAGYDAAVLQAGDADALARWLKEHGYEGRPALSAWLSPYVAARWTITAFKVAGEPGGEAVAGAVRMSFRTERPFFPYREPAPEGRDRPPRSLRLFFVGPERVRGALEDGTAFPGRVEYADRRPDLPALLAGVLSPDQLPPAGWLTAFQDPSSPRPGTADLYFSPAPAEPLLPQPEIIYQERSIPVPLDVFGGVAIGIWLIVRRAIREKDEEE
jgi:hypothetical protein